MGRQDHRKRGVRFGPWSRIPGCRMPPTYEHLTSRRLRGSAVPRAAQAHRLFSVEVSPAEIVVLLSAPDLNERFAAEIPYGDAIVNLTRDHPAIRQDVHRAPRV